MCITSNYIYNATDILELSKKITSNTRLAWDTEFQRRNHFYPKLGLLQINLDDTIYLIDGRLDLSCIWQKLFDIELNILHSCGEDLNIFYHQTHNQKALTSIFDTQVAMGFLGYGLQNSYQYAVETFLGEHIDKDQTRSDWLAPPLSEAQKQYAANDVYYLKPLAEELITQLNALGYYEYCLEDCQNMSMEYFQQNNPDLYYLQMQNHKYTPQQNQQIQALCTWREHLAIKQDVPRHQILSDKGIRNLIEYPPRNNWQLFGHDYGIKPKTLRHYGDKILSLLNQQYDVQTDPYIPKFKITSIKNSHHQYIDQKIAELSQQLNLPKEIVFKKRWIHQLFVLANLSIHGLDNQPHNPYLCGWRKECITQPLIEHCMHLYDDQHQLKSLD